MWILPADGSLGARRDDLRPGAERGNVAPSIRQQSHLRLPDHCGRISMCPVSVEPTAEGILPTRKPSPTRYTGALWSETSLTVTQPSRALDQFPHTSFPLPHSTSRSNRKHTVAAGHATAALLGPRTNYARPFLFTPGQKEPQFSGKTLTQPASMHYIRYAGDPAANNIRVCAHYLDEQPSHRQDVHVGLV